MLLNINHDLLCVDVGLWMDWKMNREQ